MRVRDKLKQTLHLLNIIIQICLKHPTLLLFPLLAIACYILFECVFFYLLHRLFDVNVLDPKALHQWGLISLWDVSIMVVFLISPFYFIANIAKLYSKAATAYAMVALYEHRRWSIVQSLWLCKKKLKAIIQYAYASTLIMLVTDPGLKKFLRNQARQLGAGKFVRDVTSVNWFEQTFLVLPAITQQDITINQAFAFSDGLINKTFGAMTYAQFSFFNLALLLTLFIGGFAGLLATHYYQQILGVGIFFIIASIFICLFSFAEAIFQAAVYQYCFQKSTGPFTVDDIQKSFKQELDW